MKIIIVGCGKVGKNIAEELVKEKHNIVLIDNKAELVEEVSNSIDMLGVVGDGTSMEVLKETGIEDTDLLLAVTSADEINMLCCLFAKKANKNCRTIARVRNPAYNKEISYIREELGLAMAINPEMITAREMSRLIRWPSALQVESFSRGRVELISFAVNDNTNLVGKAVKDIMTAHRIPVLFVGVERGEEAIIPHGDTIIEKGDKVCIMSTPEAASKFLHDIGIYQSPIKKVMMAGGSKIAYYLSLMLQKQNIRVSIIDKDKNRCNELADLLPNASIINGYASDDNLLIEEGIRDMDCFCSLTGVDEENVLLSMYAKSIANCKVITKVNHISYDGVISNLDVGALVSPKKITASSIVTYVRGITNAGANDVETMHRILNNKVEALSFKIKEKSPIIGVPFEKLHVKQNLLVGSIIRGNDTIIPSGKTTMEVGDTVLIVTSNTGIATIEGIVK